MAAVAFDGRCLADTLDEEAVVAGKLAPGDPTAP